MEVSSKFKKVALQAAKEASQVLRDNLKKPKKISFKKDISLVTDIDLKAEERITKLIKKNFPSHSILTEESGGKIGREYTWLIDPLDGTTNYLMGVPFFSVSLALLYKNEPILGVVLNPRSQELYFAQKNKGAFLNQERIKVNQNKNLLKSTLLLSKGRELKSFLKLVKIFSKIGKYIRTVRLLGSSNLGICQIAAGKADGYIGIGLPPWDYIVGSFIAQEAGGLVTNFDRGRYNIMRNQNVFISNKFLHQKLLKIFYS
jgi:myo-inositol-1(or 4)-monophosphatase